MHIELKQLKKVMTRKIIITSSNRNSALPFGMMICVQAKAIIIKIEMQMIDK